jgi:uncharacterized protein YbjT (DUF2867 family)
MSKSAQNTILVTGATGNVGQNVVSQLVGAGVRVRALTRNPESSNLPGDVEVIRGDLSVPETLRDCMAGIDSVFLLERFLPGAAVSALLDIFAKHARRVVFLSSSAAGDDLAARTNPLGEAHANTERLIEKSGLEWTFVRPGGFAANALPWWGPQIRAGNVVHWPYAAAAVTPIHERDIAAVAVRALTEDGHNGAKYALTGPESITQAEQVRVIGEAIGRPLRFEEISPEAARQSLAAFMPPFVIDFLLDNWARMVTEPAPVSRTVEEVTGSRAHTFAEWATDHAGDFQLASENSAATPGR